MKFTQWIEEHGPEYDVPAELLNALERLGFMDESYHNDVCPCFRYTRNDLDFLLEVWTDHPNPQQRELQRERFQVVFVARFPESSDHGYTLLLTDSAADVAPFVTAIINANPV